MIWTDRFFCVFVNYDFSEYYLLRIFSIRLRISSVTKFYYVHQIQYQLLPAPVLTLIIITPYSSSGQHQSSINSLISMFDHRCEHTSGMQGVLVNIHADAKPAAFSTGFKNSWSGSACGLKNNISPLIHHFVSHTCGCITVKPCPRIASCKPFEHLNVRVYVLGSLRVSAQKNDAGNLYRQLK